MQSLGTLALKLSQNKISANIQIYRLSCSPENKLINNEAFMWHMIKYVQINKSTEDLQINELKLNKKMKVTGNCACTFRVYTHL